MRAACKIALCALILYTPLTASAADNWRGLADYAMDLHRQNAVIALPWLDRLSLRSKPTDITAVDGAKIMDMPRTAHSYDQRPRAVDKFYDPKAPRLNVVARWAGRRPGEIFSFGLDSGFAADKIRVKPGLFLGYARVFTLAKNTKLAWGVSGWFGGAVSEKACTDDFGRRYYCRTLTAWRDHRPIETRNDIHHSIVIRREF